VKLDLDLATKGINAGGGILGRPLQVIYENDKIDPAVAVKATRKLIEACSRWSGRSPQET
jgi:urea transport system substrate-binding protein